jgi:hypothetical protein
MLPEKQKKTALCLTEKGQKAARQRKSTTDKKVKIAYSRP